MFFVREQNSPSNIVLPIIKYNQPKTTHYSMAMQDLTWMYPPYRPAYVMQFGISPENYGLKNAKSTSRVSTVKVIY